MNLTLVAQNQERQRQGGDRPQVDPKSRAEKLAKDLELSDEQKLKVTTLFEEQKNALAELKDKFKDDQEGRKNAMKELRKKWDKDLEAIIGKEKFEKQKAMLQEQMKKRSEGRGPNPQNQ
jgi:hypothetical protein